MRNKKFIAIMLALALSVPFTWHVSGSDLDVSVIDINALWTKNTVRISFDSNGGGAAPGDQVYAYGIERSLPGQCSMSKPGYSFLGWSTSSTAVVPDWKPGDCSITAFGYADANDKTSKTLYAVWKADDVTTIADFLGYGKSSSTPASSAYDTASLVEKVNYLESELNTLKSDVATNKTNISTIKTDVATNKSNISTINTNINTANTNINSIKSTVSSLSSSGGFKVKQEYIILIEYYNGTWYRYKDGASIGTGSSSYSVSGINGFIVTSGFGGVICSNVSRWLLQQGNTQHGITLIDSTKTYELQGSSSGTTVFTIYSIT